MFRLMSPKSKKGRLNIWAQNWRSWSQQSYVSFTNIVDSNNGSFDTHSVKVLVQVHYPFKYAQSPTILKILVIDWSAHPKFNN